ncbi:MAG: ATP-binding cassette domain-containing protein [Acidobacteriota bacterium]
MKQIHKIYRTETVETHALHDFSLEVKAGEFVALMGRSGSGKTTFLNVAGLLDGFDSGEYWLGGENVSRLGDNQTSRIPQSRINFGR